MAREQSRVFDEVAHGYERARPDYPPQLFDDVLDFARLTPGARMLEIGAGTGKATRGFAGRGFPILCMEPGERLAAVLREQLGEDAAVEVRTRRFEDLAFDPGGFGLVFAAQSFHWLEPETAMARCAEALAPGGALALFWNRPQRGESELHRAVEACYVRIAPELWARVARGWVARDYVAEIRASGAFGSVFRAEYPFHRQYGADAYLELLRTHSDHRMLEPGVREALLRAVRDAVSGHGGRIRVDYRTDLFLARRQPVGSEQPPGLPEGPNPLK